MINGSSNLAHLIYVAHQWLLLLIIILIEDFFEMAFIHSVTSASFNIGSDFAPREGSGLTALMSLNDAH